MLPVYFERTVKNAGMLVGYIIIITYAIGSLRIILHPERGTPGFAPLIHGPIVAWFITYWIRDQHAQWAGSRNLKETYIPSISNGLNENTAEYYAMPHRYDKTGARVEVTEAPKWKQSSKVAVSPDTSLATNSETALSSSTPPPPYTASSSPPPISTEVLSASTTLSSLPPISTKDLIATLGSKKHAFLSTIETRISTYVRSTGPRCVSIIERKPAPRADELHKLGLDEWMPVFTCFLLRKKYFNHTLDSALTDPIIDIVTTSYSEFITANSADINAFFLRQITQDRVVQDAFMGYIAEQCVRAGVKHTRQQISHALTLALHHAVKSHVGQAIAHTTAHTAHVVAGHTAIVTGSSAGHAVGTMLYKLLTKHIALITSHALSHAFLSKVITVLAKKYCVAAITVCVVKAALGHMGGGHAAMLFHALAAVAIKIYIVYRISTLPKTMGEKLGAGVRAAMDGRFVDVTERALRDVVKAIQSPEGLASDVFRELSGTPGWKHDVEDLAGGFPLGDTAHVAMEKDVGRIYDRSSAIVKDVVKARRKA